MRALPITVSLPVRVEQVGALAVGVSRGVVPAAAAAVAAAAARLLNYHCDGVGRMSRGGI